MRDPNAYRRWQSLIRSRNAPGADQNALGPLEHGAYAESRVREHPIYGPIEQLALVPGYTMAKGIGLMSGRSDPGIDELAEGYRGIGRGVEKNIGDLLAFTFGTPSPVTRAGAVDPMSQGLSEDEIAAMVQRSPEPNPMPPRRDPNRAAAVINKMIEDLSP